VAVLARGYAGFWIWTSENSSSETVWKSRISLDLGVASKQNRAKTSHFALLSHYTQAIKNPEGIFQTVSLRRS